jgi:subtilisin family serine protease
VVRDDAGSFCGDDRPSRYTVQLRLDFGVTAMAKKKEHSAGGEITQRQPEEINNDLDPGLQELILKARTGEDMDPAFTSALDDGTVLVDVLAKLQEPSQPVPGLNVVRQMGQIVTGTIKIDDIDTVRGNPNVISLKRAKKVHKQLEFSVPEMNASQELLAQGLPSTAPTIDGTGVIVGVVDYGCDFNHKNFRNAGGTTRLLFLWDQRGGQSSLSPAGFNYGREFDASAINAALGSTNPYVTLGYNPGQGSHGTHVLDIAAGNGRAPNNSPGVAPGADLIFVQINASDLDEEESFGNSRKLLEAVDYIFAKAAALGRSAVVNISLGTHGGPHDGSTLAEQAFDEILSEPGRAIAISAGNSWQRGSHSGGSVSTTTTRTLGWVIQPNDLSVNELEIWYSGQAELAVALVTPSGQKLAPVPLGTTVTLQNAAGDTIARVFHRNDDPNNHDNQIDILLEPSAPSGQWGVELSTKSDSPIAFHAWIERDDPNEFNPAAQSKFVPADIDPSHTIGSVSCGRRTIAVGSYLSGVPDRELSPFTAEGPTRDGRQKPEVSAPGQWLHPYWTNGIRAARSGSQGMTRMSGTSMASPHVAGMIALIMQAAGQPLTVEQIRQAIIDTARRNPPPGSGWHSRYGFGRVDTLSALGTQIPSPPIAVAPRAATAEIAAVNGRSPAFHDFVTTVAEAARTARARVRVQIEVEPSMPGLSGQQRS